MAHRFAGGSDELFALLVASVQDYAIFALDPNGHVVTWNAGAERIKGYKASEIIGRHFSTFYPPEDVKRGKPEAALAQAAAAGRVEDEGWRLRKDGARFWANVVITALRTPDGELHGFAKVTRDLTRRHEIEQAEHRAREEAEEASRVKDEFLATVSHELRTPLNVMVGTLWRLRSGRENDPEARQRLLEIMDRNVRLQTRLVEELLDVARMMTGKVKLELRLLEVGPMVESAVDSISAAARARGITVHTHYDPAAGPILADKDRLPQILWNLLANAVKFTPVGGRIDVRLERQGVDVMVEVADTGRGIAPAFLPRMFERFTQEEDSRTRDYSGLGLGLAVAKHLAEAHGGRIEAHSAGVGHGATFRVYFPVPTLTTPMDVLETALLPGDDDVPTLRDIRVVVVDDQPDAREAVHAVLSYSGADVRAVGSVQEALRCLESFRPHVLLADIAMPDEDGFALIEKVRRDLTPELRRVPAAALTAYTTTDTRLRILSAGYQLHISKPVDPMELVTAVSRLVTLVGEAGRAPAPEAGA